MAITALGCQVLQQLIESTHENIFIRSCHTFRGGLHKGRTTAGRLSGIPVQVTGFSLKVITQIKANYNNFNKHRARNFFLIIILKWETSWVRGRYSRKSTSAAIPTEHCNWEVNESSCSSIIVIMQIFMSRKQRYEASRRDMGGTNSQGSLGFHIQSFRHWCK